jgi:all-trans-retinol 13,14-reductase
VWGLVFLVNASIYIFLELSLTIVLSNIFVVVGIAFSVIYPVKVPVRRTYREFKKFDWRVEVDLKRSREGMSMMLLLLVLV